MAKALVLGPKDEALLFLAGVWTEDKLYSSPRQEHLRRVALSHAAAFLKAQFLTPQPEFGDFQVMIPTLLVALGATDKEARQLAVECLRLLAEMQCEHRTSMYAVDTIYVSHSDVQIYSTTDSGKYLKALTEHGDSFVADQDYLSAPATHYMLPAFSCCRLKDFSSAFQLLSAVGTVSEPAKLPFGMNLIEEMISRRGALNASDVEERQQETYFGLPLPSFDKASAPLLDEDPSRGWTVFKKLIERSVDTGTEHYIRILPMEQVRTHLFRLLSQERKVEITSQLPKLSIQDVANSKPTNLSYEPEAISCIFGTLRALSDIREAAVSSVEYILQLMLPALDKATTAAVTGPIPAGVMRTDVLIDLINVTLRNRPGIVIQNVMPIFTFMGSNVFHRDDSFSFRVVQKTNEGIVPVMVKSLKSNMTIFSNFLLVSGSRDFLRIFSDAAVHIPRYRRTFFFSHLVDVPGPRSFLAPVAMLLVDRSATRDVRHAEDDVGQTLALPLALLAKHPHELRLDPFCQYQTILEALVDVLKKLTLDDHSPSPSIAVKKQVIPLLVFLGYAIHAFGDHPRYKPQISGTNIKIQQLLTRLVQVANLTSGTTPLATEEIGKEARRSLIKVADFVRSAASLLRFDDVKVKAGAVDLFAEQLPLIATTTRASISPTILEILQHLKDLLSDQNGPLTALTLLAVNAIAVITMDESERALMSSLIEYVLREAGHTEACQDAISVLTSLTSKLGPRLLPYVTPLVSVGIKCTGDHIHDGGLRHLALVLVQKVWKVLDPSRIVTCCLGLVGKGDTDVLSAVTSKVPARSILLVLRDVWMSSYRDVDPQDRTLKRCNRGLPQTRDQLDEATFKPFFHIVVSSDADMPSASQKVLHLPELVIAILQNLTKNKDLYSAALVCHAWCEIALDSLWVTANSLAPLFNTLCPMDYSEEDLSWTFQGDLNQADWPRYQAYANRIRSLNIELPTGRWSRPVSKSSMDALQWNIPSNYNLPRPTSLRYEGIRQEEMVPSVRSTLPIVSTSISRLDIFEIHYIEPGDEESSAEHLFRQFEELDSASLEVVSLALPYYFSDSQTLPGLIKRHASTISSLELRLCMTDTIWTAVRQLHNLKDLNIRSGRGTIRTSETPETIVVLNDLASEAFIKLKTLSIHVDASELETKELRFGIGRSLSRMARITTLNLRSFVPMLPYAEELLQEGHGLTNLEELRIDYGPGPTRNEGSERPPNTISFLVSVLQKFPQIKHFSTRIVCNSIPAITSSKPAACLEVLDTSWSPLPIPEAEDVAGYLRSILPRTTRMVYNMGEPEESSAWTEITRIVNEA
ncbi:snoRNA-binding rRNA-processing protein utp10 [Tulasnella sp. 427]|nr:snoRNA-binding rRNA-processing protein utp10 [Tulasnella sp. 427]